MDTEKIAKEALLTFFLETSEPYIGSLTALDVCNIGRWVTRIWETDVYSMRTHLLLLHHMIRSGHLQQPYNVEPDPSASIPQFEPVSMFNDEGPPTVPQLLRLMLQKLRLQPAPAPTQQPSQCSVPAPCVNTNPACHLPAASSCAGQSFRSKIPIRSQSQPRNDSQPWVDKPRTRSVERCVVPGTGCCQQYACVPDENYPYRAGTSTPVRGSAHRPCFPMSPIRGETRPGRSRIQGSDHWITGNQNYLFNSAYPASKAKSNTNLWCDTENNSSLKNILSTCSFHLDRLKPISKMSKQWRFEN